MQESDPYYESPWSHPLLKASLDMDQSFEGLRRDLIQPFAEPATSDEHWKVWHGGELRCRPQCEQAGVFWIEHRFLPPLEDEAAYFLCRRFDQASNFLQNLFDRDGMTVVSHGELSLDEFLWWVLVVWWDAHGRGEAYFEDLQSYEFKHEDDKRA